MTVFHLPFLFMLLTTGWCVELTLHLDRRNLMLDGSVLGFSVLADSKENIVCVLESGDGDCSIVLDERNFIVEEELTHGAFGDINYKNSGSYVVEIVCMQGLNGTLVKRSSNATVHDELVGVKMSPEQKDIVVTLLLDRGEVQGRLNFTFEKGTSVVGEFRTDEGRTGMAHIDEDLGMGYVTFKATDFVKYGTHIVHVSVYNLLNNSNEHYDVFDVSNNVTLTYQVVYEKALQVGILSPDLILVNTTAIFITEQSSQETCIWQCSESAICTENQSGCNMTYKFPVLGKQKVSVTVKNNIQQKTGNKYVQVLVPVSGFSVSLESLDNARDNSLFLHRESNDLTNMGSLHAEVSIEKSTILMENLPIPEFQNDFMLLNIQGRENQTLRILISSNLSSQELFINIPIAPKSPVPEFSINNVGLITIPDGYAHFTIYLPTNTSISTDINCTLDFKDTSPSQTVQMSSLATNGVGHVFLTPGFRQVSFFCINEASAFDESSSIDVKSFQASDFQFDWPAWLSRNSSEVMTIFSVNIDLFGVEKIPPGVMMEWRFGDGQNISTSLNKWTQQHAYYSRGEFNVSVSVSTGTMDVHIFHLPVRVGVLRFDVDSFNGISHTQAISFLFSGMIGKLIECILWFGDTTSKYVFSGKDVSKEEPIQLTKLYEISGIFAPELLCWSELFVEHVSLLSTITITNPVGNISLYLQQQISYPDGTGVLELISNSLHVDNTFSCLIDFGDGTIPTASEVNLSLNNSKTFSHTFKVVGWVTVSGNCTHDNVTYLYFSNSTQIVSNCFASSEPFSNLDSVVQSVISERVVIAARPDIRCLNMTPEFLWKIDKNGVQVDLLQPNGTLLVLPPRTMKPGTYRIYFYANFVEMPTIFITDMVILKYFQTPLQAKVKGGNYKRFGYDQPVVMDAITDSYDPDVERGNDPDLSFRWVCSSHESEKEAFSFITASDHTPTYCTDLTLPDKGLIVVVSHCLQQGKWYLFKVIIQKDIRTVTNYQLIYITGFPLQVDLRCRVNCLEKVDAEFSLSLESECLDCTRDERRIAQYSWKLYRTDSYYMSRKTVNNLRVLTTTGTNISSISIQKNSLPPGTEHTLELTIWIGQNRSQQILDYNFIVNLPPYNGSCSLFPVQGVAVYDQFQVTCTGWLDEGFRKYRSAFDDGDLLVYEFLLRVGEKKSMLFSGGSRRTSWQELNAGRAVDNYTVTITVRIFDRHKGVTQVDVYGKVTPPIVINSKPIQTEEVEVIINSFEEKMAQSLVGGDIHAISRTLEATSTVLNELVFPNKSSPLPEEPNDWLQDIPPDVNIDNQNGSTWKSLWKDLITNEIEPQRAQVRKTTRGFCRGLSSLVNSTKPSSLSAVHMLSTAVLSVVDKKTDDDLKLESVSNVLDVLGDSLNVAVDTETSDVQVVETLTSVLESVGDTMSSMYTLDPVLDEIDTRKDAQDVIDKVKSYSDTVQSENITEKVESSDLQDEERIFFLTRSSILKQHKYRKQQTLAHSNLGKLVKSVGKALDVASDYLVEGQEPATFTAPRITASVEKNLLKRLVTKGTVLNGVAIQMSLTNVDNIEDSEVDDMQQLTQQTIVHEKNPFIWNTETDESFVTSPVLQIRLLDEDKKDVDEKKDIRMTYRVKMPHTNPVISTIAFPRYITLDWDQMLYHRTELRSLEDHLLLYLKPSSRDVAYDVFLRSGSFPTSFQHDFHTYVEFRSGDDLGLRSLNCPPGNLPRSGTIYIGLQPRLLKGEMSTEATKIGYSLSPVSDDNTSEILQAPYDFGVTSVGCKKWDDILDLWNPRICQVEETESTEGISCGCEESLFSSLSVGTTFYVPVNAIDFSTVFTKIDLLNNASVVSVVGGLLAIYCILSVWARRKDKRDMLKWGVTSLKDNVSQDKYHYMLTVHTGMRLGAGTESQIGFIIAGEKHDTGMRLLADGIRTGLERQTIVHYLMTVPACLGDLQYVRIWHDNSGKGSAASWFLHKFVVEDIQLNKKFVFYCGKWLAIDKDDERIDRLLPVSGNQSRNFRKLFYNNMRKNVSDKHLWFSVVLRPHSSFFTRFQRLSCCLSLLYLTMISNAIFYHSEANIVRPTAVNIGILRFSTHQMYISVIGLLIVTPVNALIVWLFTKSRPGWVVLPGGNNSSMLGFCDDKLDEDKQKLSDVIPTNSFMKPKMKTLPHFCIYIAYGLLILAIFSSAFFLILYSQQWGKTKSEEWLTSFVLSFLESFLVLDPIKVLCVALVISLFVRKPEDNNTEDMASQVQSSSTNLDKTDTDSRPKCPAPLPESELNPVRTATKKKTEAFYVVKEIVLYLLFLMVIYTLGYANRDYRSYSTKNNIYNMMVYKQKDRRPGFVNVKTTEDFFHWLNVTAFPALFQENYSEGSRRSRWDRYFMSDLQSFRVGPPRLRQLRGAQLSECERISIPFALCNTQYRLGNGENRNFCFEWKDPPCSDDEVVTKLSSAAWEFTSSSDVWGMPVVGRYNTYYGGGYIAQMDVNEDVSMAILKELFKGRWVDRQARAVALEFTIYNANTNMFCYVSLMIEFPETGGVMRYGLVAPFRVYHHVGALGTYIMYNEIIFLLFLLIAFINFVTKIKQYGISYLDNRWHIVDLFYIVGSFVGLIMYWIRDVMTKKAISLLHDDPRQFINFYHIVLWDEAMVDLIGIVSAAVTIRTLNILGYNRRASGILRVLTNAGGELFYFSIIFFIVFLAFVILGYMLFGTQLEAYHTLLLASSTLMNSMIGKTPFDEMRRTEPLLAQFYFVLFVFFVVLVLLTMFMAILNDSIAFVRASDKEDSSQHEMLLLLFNKILESLSLFFPSIKRYTKDSKAEEPGVLASIPDEEKEVKHSTSNRIVNQLSVRRKQTTSNLAPTNLQNSASDCGSSEGK